MEVEGGGDPDSAAVKYSHGMVSQAKEEQETTEGALPKSKSITRPAEAQKVIQAAEVLKEEASGSGTRNGEGAAGSAQGSAGSVEADLGAESSVRGEPSAGSAGPQEPEQMPWHEVEAWEPVDQAPMPAKQEQESLGEWKSGRSSFREA